MSTRKTPDLTTAVLIEIRDQIRAMRTEVGSQIDTLRAEMVGRLDVTNARLGNVRDFMGDVVRDQRLRLERLEARMDRVEATSR